MRKSLMILKIMVLFVLLWPVSVLAAVPDLSAEAAILVDASSGRVLFAKNAHDRLPQASTTKITTALVALEKGDLQQKIRVSADFVNPGEAGIWLEPGEKQILNDLLYSLMLKSANDAAAVIAIAIAGSEAAFIEMMNQRVRELGLNDTHYTNPHGLHNDYHYSSAYDLAMITREAMKYQKFREIITTKYHILPWPGHDYSRIVYNRNRLLKTYEGANGVKNGFTRQAGNCLVGSAVRNGLHLIAVVLHSSRMYDEVGVLFDYGFQNYESTDLFPQGETVKIVPVKGGKKDRVKAVSKQVVTIALKKGEQEHLEQIVNLPENVKAPVERGQRLGTVTIKLGKEVFQTELIAAENIKRKSFFPSLWDKFVSVFNGFLASIY